MAKLINIGFGNVVNSQKIVAVVSPDAAPVKRMVQSVKGTRSLIDATQGRKTKAVIVTSDDYLVLSALQPETIARSAPINASGTADAIDQGSRGATTTAEFSNESANSFLSGLFSPQS